MDLRGDDDLALTMESLPEGTGIGHRGERFLRRHCVPAPPLRPLIYGARNQVIYGARNQADRLVCGNRSTGRGMGSAAKEAPAFGWASLAGTLALVSLAGMWIVLVQLTGNGGNPAESFLAEMGELLVPSLAWVAAQEPRRRSERTRAAWPV